MSMANTAVCFLMFLMPDPDIDRLVADTGSPSWVVRDRATDQLRMWGEVAAPRLRKVINDPDPEIAARAEVVVEELYGLLYPTGYDTLPWIDGLPPDYKDRAAVVTKYLSRYDASPGDDRDYPGYRFATRDFVRDLYDGGMKREDIVRLLDYMVQGELQQRFRMGGKP